jgi:hypothetical protein
MDDRDRVSDMSRLITLDAIRTGLVIHQKNQAGIPLTWSERNWGAKWILSYLVGAVLGVPLLIYVLFPAWLGFFDWTERIDAHLGNTGAFDIVGLTSFLWIPAILFAIHFHYRKTHPAPIRTTSTVVTWTIASCVLGIVVLCVGGSAISTSSTSAGATTTHADANASNAQGTVASGTSPAGAAPASANGTHARTPARHREMVLIRRPGENTVHYQQRLQECNQLASIGYTKPKECAIKWVTR